MTRFDNESSDPFAGVPDVDERLADWVDGTMSARDRERFEAEMRVNPSLRQQVEEYEQTVSSIQTALRGDVHETDLADRVMAGLAQEATGATRSKGSVLPFVWATACAAALLGIAVMIDTWGGTSQPLPNSSSSDNVASELNSGATRPEGVPMERANAAPRTAIPAQDKLLKGGQSKDGPSNDGQSNDGPSNDAKAFRVSSERAEVDKGVAKTGKDKPGENKTGEAKLGGKGNEERALAETGSPVPQPAGAPVVPQAKSKSKPSPKVGEAVEVLALEKAGEGDTPEAGVAATRKQAAASSPEASRSSETSRTPEKKAKTERPAPANQARRRAARGGRAPAGPGSPAPTGPAGSGPGSAGPTTGGPAGPTTGGPARPSTGGPPSPVGTPRGMKPLSPKGPRGGGRGRGNGAPAKPRPQTKPSESASELADVMKERRRSLVQPTYEVRFAYKGKPAEVLPLVTIEGLTVDFERAKEAPKVSTGSDDFYLGSQRDGLGPKLRSFFKSQMRPRSEWLERLEERNGTKSESQKPESQKPESKQPKSKNNDDAIDRQRAAALAATSLSLGGLQLFAVGPEAISGKAVGNDRQARRKTADLGRAGRAQVPGRKEAAGPEFVERDWLVVGKQKDVQRLLAELRKHADQSRSAWRSGEARIAKPKMPADRSPKKASPSTETALQRIVIRFRARR